MGDLAILQPVQLEISSTFYVINQRNILKQRAQSNKDNPIFYMEEVKWNETKWEIPRDTTSQIQREVHVKVPSCLSFLKIWS